MPDGLLHPKALLDDAYRTGSVTNAHGVAVSAHSQITPIFAQALCDFVEREQPKTVVEVGMALGFSSLAILSALPEDGILISVDPFQDTDYEGAGMAQVARSTHAKRHRLVAEADYLALPKMIEQGLKVDFAYIDGMHTFDYVLLDAFYLDKLVPVGGAIAFNDCGFRSIHKFLHYFVKHRKYIEIDVGLPRNFRGANPIKTLIRTMTRRSNQDRYFRKVADWEPEHNFFRNF